MISDWLNQSELEVDIEEDAITVEENSRPDNLIHFLGGEYLKSNVNPERIKRKIERLRRSARELDSDTLREKIELFIKKAVLPDSDRKSTRSGLFGEFLSEAVLVELDNFERLVYKLRHRESSNWAPKLVDICVFKRGDPSTVCMVEVKTNSSGKDNSILCRGVESLEKALANKYEALDSIISELEKQHRYDDANFIDRLLQYDEYDQYNEVCAVVDSNYWDFDAFDNLSQDERRKSLNKLSIRVVVIDSLRKMIDDVHNKALCIGTDLNHE